MVSFLVCVLIVQTQRLTHRYICVSKGSNSCLFFMEVELRRAVEVSSFFMKLLLVIYIYCTLVISSKQPNNRSPQMIMSGFLLN